MNGLKRDRIPDLRRGATWADCVVTHPGLVGTYIQQCGCTEMVWALSKHKNDASFGATLTYVDGQHGCTGDMPNLNAFPQYIKDKYGSIDMSDPTNLLEDEALRLDEVVTAMHGSTRLSKILTTIKVGSPKVEHNEYVVSSIKEPQRVFPTSEVFHEKVDTFQSKSASS